MRRAQALHAAAFLVDKDKRFVAFDGVAEIGDERAELWVDLQFRANRIRPQGFVPAKKPRSSSLSEVLAQPEMKARRSTMPS